MIEIRGLTKRFGDTVAVDDVSFDVVPGRVTGFLGPNGSGKSTTMRAIMGLDWPTSGTVTVNGRPSRATAGHCLRWEPCSTRRRSMAGALPITICCLSPRATASRVTASTRSSNELAWAR